MGAYRRNHWVHITGISSWRSSIAMNSSLLTGFIKNRFAGKDRKKPFTLKWVFYRGLTLDQSLLEHVLLLHWDRLFREHFPGWGQHAQEAVDDGQYLCLPVMDWNR